MAVLVSGAALLLAMALGLAIRHLRRARTLPSPPLRLLLAGLICWGLAAFLPLDLLPASHRLWLNLGTNLLLCLSGMRLLAWLLLELPGGLRWWRPPPDLLVQILTLTGWVVLSVLVVRQTTRFDLVNLVATSAVLTAVIGLAAQEGLKDLFSGLELQLSGDFAIGDWLELPDGRRGTVVSISWRETCLRTMDGLLLVIPNSKITADIFINRSHFSAISDRFEIALDCDYPPGRAIPLLSSVLQHHPLVLRDPAPQVRLHAFLESSISYELQVWQKPAGDRALLDLRGQLLQQCWYALRRDGQSIPYPVRELRRRPAAAPLQQPNMAGIEQCRRALASVPIFAELNDDDLEILVSGSQVLIFGPGEAVVREGAEGDSLYCLLRGTVEVLKHLDAQTSHRVTRLQAGDVFGEMTLFLNAPRSATVRTLEECLLLQLERSSVVRMLEGNPALFDRIAALVSARQEALDQLGQLPQAAPGNPLLETMRRLFLAVRGDSQAR